MYSSVYKNWITWFISYCVICREISIFKTLCLVTSAANNFKNVKNHTRNYENFINLWKNHSLKQNKKLYNNERHQIILHKQSQLK